MTIIHGSFEKEAETKVVVNKTGTKVTKSENSRELTYVVDDYEKNLTYSWSFDKKNIDNTSIKDDLFIDVDLRLSIKENLASIDDTVKQDKLVVSFEHHGELPSKAVVKIKVDNKFNDGDKLYLYYYNPDNDDIEFKEKNLVVKDGEVEFSINHCSDYFLTATIVQDAVDNPKNINYIIIGMVVVIIVLVASTLGQSKK